MERKIHNFESLILDELTFEKEGYYPNQYGPVSAKFIWATCRFCGYPARLRKGFYKKANNSACHKECRLKEQSISGSPFKDECVKEKSKRTNLERYGSEFASQNKDISKKISQARLSEKSKEKTKKTNLEKYGVENPFQSEEVKEKIKQTMLEKYGVEHPLQSEKIKENRKNTCLDKYGFSNPLQNDEIKQKRVKTSIEKYGYESPMQNEEIINKQLETMLEKYGYQYAIQNPDIKKKIQNTNQSKYGSYSPFGSSEVQEKSKQTNLERYGVENPFASQEIREKIEKSFLDKYGVRYPSQSPLIREKIIQAFIDRFGVDSPMKDPVVKAGVMSKFKEHVERNSNGQFDVINTLRSEEIWKKMETGLSLEELSDHFNLHYPSVASAVNEDEFKSLYNNLYTYPKNQIQNNIKKEIKNFYHHEIMVNSRKEIPPLELDIFLPKNKFAIEFNGNFWHSEARLPAKEARQKHITKTKLCEEKGIRLFHIFEHQWKNRKNQILNFIKTILGLNTHNIGARKCQINYDECKDFIENNHIQGYGNGTIKYFNLTYNNEIMASMTASKHHRQNIAGKPVVLNRLCFKDGVNIQGGSSKLFKCFVEWTKKESYDRILSWSDNCWTQGNIYNVLGFSLQENYGPDYFYWDSKNNKYVSKQSQRKKATGCPPNLTEREWCIERGLFRMWDTGKRLWTYNL